MLVDIKAVLRNTSTSLEIRTDCKPGEIDLSFQGFEFPQPAARGFVNGMTIYEMIYCRGGNFEALWT